MPGSRNRAGNLTIFIKLVPGSEIERRKSGVCGAGLNRNIYGRHVWLGDTYEYERERVWLRLSSHSGETRTRQDIEKQSIYGRVLQEAG